MSVICVLLIALLIGLWVALIIALIFYEIENHQKAKLKAKDEEFNDQMLSMCIRCKQAKTCPECCEKCAWARRMKRGVIELRGRL